MSCPHGNHEDACDLCDELDRQYGLGLSQGKRNSRFTPEEKEILEAAADVFSGAESRFIFPKDWPERVRTIARRDGGGSLPPQTVTK